MSAKDKVSITMNTNTAKHSTVMNTKDKASRLLLAKCGIKKVNEYATSSGFWGRVLIKRTMRQRKENCYEILLLKTS